MIISSDPNSPEAGILFYPRLKRKVLTLARLKRLEKEKYSPFLKAIREEELKKLPARHNEKFKNNYVTKRFEELTPNEVDEILSKSIHNRIQAERVKHLEHQNYLRNELNKKTDPVPTQSKSIGARPKLTRGKFVAPAELLVQKYLTINKPKNLIVKSPVKKKTTKIAESSYIPQECKAKHPTTASVRKRALGPAISASKNKPGLINSRLQEKMPILVPWSSVFFKNEEQLDKKKFPEAEIPSVKEKQRKMQQLKLEPQFYYVIKTNKKTSAIEHILNYNDGLTNEINKENFLPGVYTYAIVNGEIRLAKDRGDKGSHLNLAQLVSLDGELIEDIDLAGKVYITRDTDGELKIDFASDRSGTYCNYPQTFPEDVIEAAVNAIEQIKNSFGSATVALIKQADSLPLENWVEGQPSINILNKDYGLDATEPKALTMPNKIPKPNAYTEQASTQAVPFSGHFKNNFHRFRTILEKCTCKPKLASPPQSPSSFIKGNANENRFYTESNKKLMKFASHESLFNKRLIKKSISSPFKKDSSFKMEKIRIARR